MKKLDYYVENEKEMEIPYFKSTKIETHNTKSELVVKILPTNNNSEYDNLNNIIQFDIPCTTNGMDPRKLYLSGSICNPDKFDKQVDGSFHSLIKKIYVYNGQGEKIEVIEDYDLLMSVYFDTHLSVAERKSRSVNEGFAYNKFGSNSGVIKNKGYEKISMYNAYTVLNANIGIGGKKDEYKKFEYKIDDMSKKDYYADINLPKLNDWTCVKNGKLTTITGGQDIKKEENVREFKIPLMLRTIGACK